MIKLLVSLLCLFVHAGLHAEDAVAAPGWDSQAPGQAAGDAETAPANAEQVLKQLRRNFMSEAQVRVHPLDNPGLSLDGFNVFLDDLLVGQSPLQLDAFLVSKDSYNLSVEKSGWQEASRPDLSLLPDGVIEIAVIRNNPSRWYTIPAFGLGAASLVGSLVSYRQPDGERAGLGLLIGGVAIMAVTQLLARFVHGPASKQKVKAYNRRHLDKAP